LLSFWDAVAGAVGLHQLREDEDRRVERSLRSFLGLIVTGMRNSDLPWLRLLGQRPWAPWSLVVLLPQPLIELLPLRLDLLAGGVVRADQQIPDDRACVRAAR
jgi:hypothetical protein